MTEDLPERLGDLDSEFVFDPDDPLASIRAVEGVDEDERVAAVANVVRTMASAGVLDAVTEEVVRDYVVRKQLLKALAFRRIVKESRPPYPSANRSHVHTPPPPAETDTEDTCEALGCDGSPPVWAQGGDILAKLVEDLRDRCGLTGEHRNAKLLYLVVVSRVLDNPASAAVKGLSSAGKSYTVECVILAFPAAAVIAMTAMSEHALVHMRESFSRRGPVVCGARRPGEGADRHH